MFYYPAEIDFLDAKVEGGAFVLQDGVLSDVKWRSSDQLILLYEHVAVHVAYKTSSKFRPQSTESWVSAVVMPKQHRKFWPVTAKIKD